MLTFFVVTSFSQEKKKVAKVDRNCEPMEIQEVLFKKRPSPPDTTRKKSIFILPYISTSPTLGFLVGVGGTVSWYVGKTITTKQSAASFSAELTTKEQKLFQFKSNVYTDKNKFFAQGDWRYYIYSLPTFGLGTGRNNPVPAIPGYPADSSLNGDWNTEFQVKYRWLKIHEIISYNIGKNLYAGVGIHFDYHYDIEDEQLNLDSTVPQITPHYAYSTLHNFNPSQYRSSGFSMNFVYDTRDNLINAYKGYYVNVNFRWNSTLIGSDQDATQLYAEFRTYVNLEKKLPRHLIAFWMYGGYQLSGNVPYFDLWATGFDQMNSSGRGYLQGRWRGENLMYGEVEYRFPISRCTQILGGVLFLNASTASSKDADVPLFGYIRPAGGAGLRIMVAKENRTNLAIDFTVGEKSSGIYFSAMEAF